MTDDLLEKRKVMTSAWGNLIFVPYTKPFLAPLRIARRSWLAGLDRVSLRVIVGAFTAYLRMKFCIADMLGRSPQPVAGLSGLSEE